MKKLISLVLISIVVLSSFSLVGFAAPDQGSSAAAPKGYEPIVSNHSDLTVQSQEENDDPRVILIQDNLPWSSEANSTVLTQLGVPFVTVSTSDLDSLELWDYDMIVMANDQTMATYQNYKSFKSNLDDFANFGGVIVYGACDEGWASGTIQVDLPGNVKKAHGYHYNNYVADNTHPIVTGEMTDQQVLTDSDLYHNYCSHTYFVEETLPKDSKVILRSSVNDAPTLVEYQFGNGYVIASGLTWEHNYIYHTYGGSFSLKSMDDLFAYALSLCNGFIASTDKMTIGRDNNSFEHIPTSFFRDDDILCEKPQYYIDDLYFDKLASFYEAGYFGDPDRIQELQKKRVSEWNGSCFGISTSMALVYMKQVALSNFVPGKTFYHDAGKPKDSSAFRSLINYYQLSWQLPQIRGDVSFPDEKDSFKKEMKTIIKLAEQTNITGQPFIFRFGWSYWGVINKKTGEEGIKTAGHSIVCTGVSETNNGFVLEFIDPNSTSGCLKATVPNDCGDIVFSEIYQNSEIYDSGSYKKYELSHVGHTLLSELYPFDIDGEDNAINGQEVRNQAANASELDKIVFDSNAEFTIVADDGTTLIFDGAELSGTMEITDVQCFEKGDSCDYSVIVKSHETYKVSSRRNTLELSINNYDNYFAFSGTGARTLTFDLTKSIEAEGQKMDCDLFVSAEGKNTDMVRIENDRTNNLSLTLTDSNVIAEGDNVRNSIVTGFYNSTIYDIDGTQDGQALVINKDNTISFKCKLSASELTLMRDETAQVTARISSEDSNYTVTWTSSDNKVASVDDNGKITAKRRGTADIICTVKDSSGNETKGACKVTVKYTVWQWICWILFFGWIWM